ncbi:MAG: PDZ domain-containing protein, partial [Acidobacteriota bacterium]
IGNNTAILSRTGESAGIGFAIPVSTVNRILPVLIERGQVIRAWLGLSGRTLTPRLARALDLPVSEGVLVEQVADGSSADAAGIQGGDRRVFAGNVPLLIGGDILVEVGGRKVTDVRDLTRIMEDKRPGQNLEFVYYRSNRRISRTVELVGRNGGGRRFRF